MLRTELHNNKEAVEAEVIAAMRKHGNNAKFFYIIYFFYIKINFLNIYNRIFTVFNTKNSFAFYKD